MVRLVDRAGVGMRWDFLNASSGIFGRLVGRSVGWSVLNWWQLRLAQDWFRGASAGLDLNDVLAWVGVHWAWQRAAVG